jgi:coenzyme F420-dependent glucose-6-phosphate dehydrogenase
VLGTSVLTPTLRYAPAIVAQAFGTLGLLAPGRVFLGVGTGEAMNETPATGAAFPERDERRARLGEAVALIRRLWSEDRVDFRGDFYETARATVYDRPDVPVPLLIAASGEQTAELAGRVADGLICTSGKAPELYGSLLDAVAAGAAAGGRDPRGLRRMIEVKVAYDHNLERAYASCLWWAGLALAHEQKVGIDDPLELERVADAQAARAYSRFIVSDDPDQVVERIAWYADLGFDDLVVHGPGGDQRRFLEHFCDDVLPGLRRRVARGATPVRAGTAA